MESASVPQAGLATAPPHTHDLSVTNDITAVAAARLAPASCASPHGTAHQMAADEEGACTAKAFGRLRAGAPAQAAAPAAALTTAAAAALAAAPGPPTGQAARALPGSPRAHAYAARPARQPRSCQQLQRAARPATVQQGPRSGASGERSASASQYEPSICMPACARAPDTTDQGRSLPACTQRQTAAREGRHAVPPPRCQGVAAGLVNWHRTV